jgi:hypothetical protein
MISAKKRYKYLIRARNYHFSQFRTWMVFFITINGGLLVAYGQNGLRYSEKILIVVLGYIASFLFHCSAKGYRYWSTNFTTLINHCEKNGTPGIIPVRVYSCFANKSKNKCILSPLKTANISTSKIVSLFAFILTYGWGDIAYFIRI